MTYKKQREERAIKDVILALSMLAQIADPQDAEMVNALRQSVYLFRDLLRNRIKEVELPRRANLSLVKE